MFGILKPAKHIDRIQDPKVVKKKYLYWQIRTLYGMYAGYTTYYFTRKNLPFILPALMAALGYSMVDMGWILSISSLMYGMSKFTSGLVSDRSNPRYFMAFGLIITGLINIVFGFSSSLGLLALLWGVNGYFQGCGWPPCSRLLTHWYGRKERARWWAVWNTSHNVGGFVIPLLTLWMIKQFGDWRYGMFVPGAIAILVGIFLINRLRDTPQSLGLPPIEVYRGETDEPHAAQEERELSAKEILLKYVLGNGAIWLLAMASFGVYFVRQAMNDWSLVFLTNIKGYEVMVAGFCVGLFEVGGLFGSLVSGWVSDLVFKGKRGPVNLIFSIAVVGAVSAFWFVPSGHPWLSCAVMFSIGFFIFGPQMLIGIVAAELSHKKAAATASGFAGLVGYAGAAAAGAPLAALASNYGWQTFFATVACFGALVVVCFIPLWGRTHRTDEEKSKAEFA